MAIAEGKKRISVTLPVEEVENLKKLVDLYAEESLGKVTASDVVEQLIKNDLKIRTSFTNSKNKK